MNKPLYFTSLTASRLPAALLLAISFIPLAGSENLLAQAGGGGGGGRTRGQRGDPAQFQARRMERFREQLEVKNDDEWKVIQQRIERVLQAENDLRAGGFGGFRRGGTNTAAADGGTSQAGPRGNRGGGTPPETSPELTALQASVDSKGSPDEIKAKLTRLRESTKLKEANLAKARDDLRQVLSIRQEALAVIIRLLR